MSERASERVGSSARPERPTKTWKERAKRWAVEAGIVLAVVFAMSAWQTRGHLSGVPAPLTSLTALDGTSVSLASLKGKPVLVAFWAPWCGVCKTESPNLSWVRGVVGDRAHVISVASAYGDVREVQAYVAERGVDYPVLLGEDATAQAFHVRAYPTVYFLDAQGTVKGSAVGYTTSLGLLARLFL